MQVARKPYVTKKAEELCDLINCIIELPKAKHWNQLSDEMLELVAEINSRYLTEFDFKKAYQDGLITREQSQVIEKFVRWDKSLGLYD
jgi:hypothetical protein